MPTVEIISIGTHWPSGGFVYTSYPVHWQIYLAILSVWTWQHCPYEKKSCTAWLHRRYPPPTMQDPLKSWQDSHLESPRITHGNATVQGVTWDRHWGSCPGSLAASPVSPNPSTVNHTTTWMSKYTRRAFPGVIMVAPQEALLFFSFFFLFFISNRYYV